MEGALQKGYVAEQFSRSGSRRVPLGPAPTPRKKYDRQIRPWRLRSQQGDKLPRIGADQRFFGYNGKSNTGRYCFA